MEFILRLQVSREVLDDAFDHLRVLLIGAARTGRFDARVWIWTDLIVRLGVENGTFQ